MIRSMWALGLSAAFLMYTACQSQVEPGYQGEPVLRLTGTVSASEPLPATEIVAELRWVNFLSSGRERGSGGESPLDSQGEFPTRFVLEVYDLPWSSWLNDFTQGGALPRESRIGLAQLVASGDESFRSSGWEAISRQVLVYAEADILPGTTSATFAGGELSAGFHVLEVVDEPCDSYVPPGHPEEGDLDCLRPAPKDLESDLDLRFYKGKDPSDRQPTEVPHQNF